ncbi:hypothetical protein CU097_012592 [Rhizopus azygosporus]|uniref:C2H2-type domain-containing protein n=1 Tax=Rhizopus azygosporus TaxID=86630 RepID=A0A367KAC2_RHIAZ|nr:hypothetical protein CU097_012592 [Rhizopus azygosporus]
MNQQQQQQEQEQQPRVTTTRKQPTRQNKHACTYPDCSWSFKRYEHLKRHMLVHTGERPHLCPYPGCGKRFSRSDNFHAHYRTHEKKAFKQKQDILIKEERMPVQQGISILPQQDQHYYGNYPLLPTPSPPKQQVNFVYNNSNNSNSINNQCEEEARKPHACDHPNCDRRFRRLEHLKRHMRIHTHEQPFKCTFPGCFKAFSRSDNLTQHKKTHERRGSKYTEPSAPQFMHPEPFTLVEFVRDNNTKSTNSSNSSLFGWQHPGDTSISSHSPPPPVSPAHPHHHHHHHHHHHDDNTNTSTTTTTTTTKENTNSTESVHC